MIGMIVGLPVAVVGSFAQDMYATAAKAEAPILPLSPKLRGALVAEMAGVKEGVAELSGALATGEWDKAAGRAARIRDSYIMKQQLSRAELEQLERALPADFAEMDDVFHRRAEGLRRAAGEKNYELAVFYFSKMMEACGGCHARYATHVLPGFKPTGR